MTHHDPFCQAIRDNPDDDAPRLVYADWLEENGQHDRAEFIRIQCELARQVTTLPMPPNEAAKQHCLWQRQQELWEAHGKACWEELPGLPGVGWSVLGSYDPEAVAFLRGFMASVDFGSWIALRNQSHKVFATAPVQHVRIRQRTVANLRRMLSLPWVKRVRSFEFYGLMLGDEGAAVLASSASLAGLVWLGLAGNQLGDLGAAALASSKFLDQLTNLILWNNPISEEGRKLLRERFGGRVHFSPA